MLKSELLNLIENIKDDGIIDEIILKNGFAKPISDEEGFNELVATNKIVKSALDSRVSKALKTYQNGTEKQHIEDAKAELRKELAGENETTEQKQLREMLEENRKMKKEIAMSKIANAYSTIFEEAKIPAEFRGYILGTDTDENIINERLETFKSVLAELRKANEEIVQKQVQDRLGGYIPPKEEQKVNAMTKEKFLGMDIVEQMRWAEENADAYKEIINN